MGALLMKTFVLEELNVVVEFIVGQVVCDRITGLGFILGFSSFDARFNVTFLFDKVDFFVCE